MKKTFTFIVALFLTAMVFGQTPMFFNTNQLVDQTPFHLQIQQLQENFSGSFHQTV